MPGRLREHWSEWEKLHPNKLVSSIIRNGYKIQWKNNTPPPSMWLPNSPATYAHEEFVTSQIAEVEAAGMAAQCQRDQLHYILPMDILPKSDGKQRLIINGHPL